MRNPAGSLGTSMKISLISDNRVAFTDEKIRVKGVINTSDALTDMDAIPEQLDDEVPL